MDLYCSPFESDGQPDIEEYNKFLKLLGEPVTWFNVPWLYSECYLYRYSSIRRMVKREKKYV